MNVIYGYNPLELFICAYCLIVSLQVVSTEVFVYICKLKKVLELMTDAKILSDLQQYSLLATMVPLCFGLNVVY